MPQVLFNTPASIERMKEAATVLASSSDDQNRLELGQIFRLIASNAADFDEHCQLNIAWNGSHLLGILETLNGAIDEKIDEAIGAIYRFLVEYDLSTKNDAPRLIKRFLHNIFEIRASLSSATQADIEFARHQMPIAILKELINSDDLGSLRNVPVVAHAMEAKINDWEKRIARSEEQATRLNEALGKHTQAFNFVGLHDGFNDLSKHIIRELRFAQVGMAVFGFCLVVPSSIDIWISLFSSTDLSKVNLYTLVGAGIGTVTLTLLFLYFFKIALRKADSCRAQLLQVRLRMSLCRFIQSYADYSNEIKEKNPDALGKFEALIFSGIVGTEDKLPNTFDGLEQLSALAKAIRGKE